MVAQESVRWIQPDRSTTRTAANGARLGACTQAPLLQAVGACFGRTCDCLRVGATYCVTTSDCELTPWLRRELGVQRIKLMPARNSPQNYRPCFHPSGRVSATV